MSGHTPGPWEWEKELPGKEPGTVSQVLSNGTLNIIRHSARWPLEPEDARLIASAPAMLEALREVEAHLAEQDANSGHLREYAREAISRRLAAARAAIAAATGEEVPR